MEAGIQKIPVSQIDRDLSQPRQDFDEEALQELARSIKDNGLLMPVSLRKNGQGRYQLIAGERRFRAVQILGWTEVPAIVHDVDQNGFRKMQLLENLVRTDLNPVEKARAFKQMLSEGMTDEEVGRSIGKEAQYVRWLTQILNCREQALHLIAKGQLPVWVGWHLSRLTDNGQFRALRTFQMHRYSANEMVAVCERIYAEEHKLKLFDDTPLTSDEIKVVRAFEKSFTRLFLELNRLVKLAVEKPGLEIRLDRKQVKEVESRMRWLDKLLIRREKHDDDKG